MTSSKNTNDPHREDMLSSSKQNKANYSNNSNKNADNTKNNTKNNNNSNFDDAWSNFIADHSDDFNDIANSRNAKSFEEHARRKDKKKIQGPRDNTSSSWLDVDKTMDEYGDDFVPPNPNFNNISWETAILWIVFVVGIAGIIVSAFLPDFASIIGVLSGIFLLLGGAGLLMCRKKSSNYEDDYNDYDDGARV